MMTSVAFAQTPLDTQNANSEEQNNLSNSESGSQDMIDHGPGGGGHTGGSGGGGHTGGSGGGGHPTPSPRPAPAPRPAPQPRPEPPRPHPQPQPRPEPPRPHPQPEPRPEPPHPHPRPMPPGPHPHPHPHPHPMPQPHPRPPRPYPYPHPVPPHWPRPYPYPIPPPLPDPSQIVVVYPNYTCLDTLTPTDSATLATDAANCDMTNPDRGEVESYLCTEVNESLDEVKAQQILSLSMTPVTDSELDAIENAASILYYRCEF